MTGDQGITAVKIWDVGRRGGAEWANLALAAGPLGGVAFSADGRRVVAAPEGGSITVADARTGEPAFVLRGFPGGSDAASIGISRDGTLAAAVGGTVRMWDLNSRREGYRVAIDSGVARVAWAPDGARLATAGGDGVIRMLDRAGTVVADLPGEPGYRLSDVSFSPDGRLVAAARLSLERPGTGAEQVTLWDWRRGEIVRTLPGAAFALAFSHDGARVATTSLEGPARIRSVRDGRLLAQLAGHTGAVYDVAFAPDDSLVATASADGTVRLWDPDSGRQALVLRGHERDVWNVTFSPDGSKLASAGPEGLVRVWALDLDDLIAIARRRVTRELTAAECRQYLRGRDC
jgi:WD40 repeat protein